MRYQFVKFVLISAFVFTIVAVSERADNNSYQPVSAISHSFTLSRSSFAAGAIAYATESSWSATDTNSVSVTGKGYVYSAASPETPYIQFRQTAPAGIWNNAATTGYITEIKLTAVAATTPATGIARYLTPRLSAFTAITSANFSTPDLGITLGTQQYVMGSTTVPIVTTWTFSSNQMFKYFYLRPDTSHTIYASSIQITYSVPSSDLETVSTFANNLLTTTDSKTGSCTAVGLNWSTLAGTYNSLTTDQKALFVSSTDLTIQGARSRYQYLRTVDPTLNKFADC